MSDYEALPSGVMVPRSASFAERQSSRRPEVREVASTADGRDITRGLVDPLTIQPPTDSVLRLRGNGDYRVYKEVLRDDQVSSTFHQRRLAVRCREWEVVPGGKGRQDKAAADFLRDTIHGIGWDRLTDKMLFGVFYGFSVGECMWGRDGRHITLEKVQVRDRSRFGFDGYNRLRLKTFTDPTGELMPDRKFWSFQTGADHDDEPYGLGLAHWLYWPVFFKRNGLKFWMIFLEKFGQPTAKGEYPANASPYEKQRLLQALEAISTDSGVIVPEGMKIDLIEAARSGTVDYTSLYERMDRAIAKVVLGQVASTEGTPGRLGNDDLQGDVRLDLVKADADLICESFNLSVVEWLMEWNYPNAKPPQVWRKVANAEDLNKVAERYKHIYDMGFRPSLRSINETFSGEWEERPPAVQPGIGMPAFAEPSEPDIVDEQVEQLAKRGDIAVQEMVQQIRALLDDVNSLEELTDRLLETWPGMDPQTEAFATVMQQALVAANMAGRHDLMEEVGQ